MHYHVYFVQCCDKKRYVKIGVARNVKSRIKTLQTGNPYKLKVLSVIKCSGQKEAYALEARLHKFFKKNHFNGEWFKKVDMKRAEAYFQRAVDNPQENLLSDSEMAELEIVNASPL